MQNIEPSIARKALPHLASVAAYLKEVGQDTDRLWRLTDRDSYWTGGDEFMNNAIYGTEFDRMVAEMMFLIEFPEAFPESVYSDLQIAQFEAAYWRDMVHEHLYPSEDIYDPI